MHDSQRSSESSSHDVACKTTAPRHKQRTVLRGADPLQIMLMIVAALAVTTLTALDIFFR